MNDFNYLGAIIDLKARKREIRHRLRKEREKRNQKSNWLPKIIIVGQIHTKLEQKT